MKHFTYTISFCVLLILSFTLLSGCERITDTGVTDGMIGTPDTDTTNTLKVGLIHPQPNYTSFGKGAELARDEINAAGGVLGMQVELIFKEETTDTVVQSTNALIEDENVVAILGPLFSSHAVKVGPVTTVPVLLGATRAEVTAEETDPNDLMFLVAGSNVLQAKLLAKVVREDLNAATAAIIWQDMDVYSVGFVNAFEEDFTSLGGMVSVKETYVNNDVMMFDSQLAAVQEAAPDVLLLASFPRAVPRIMEQARAMGIESIFIGSDGWDDPLMFTTLDNNAPLENSYYCTNLDPVATGFNNAYSAKHGNVDGIAASGYDAMRILAIAITTVGSTTDPIAIRDAIAAITDYEGATSISSFDENRNPVKSVGVRQIINEMPAPIADIIIESPQ